jgi:hypothetical protein
MSIYIQSIITSWDKEYRGGEKAAIRNGIPDSFELPIDVFVRPNEDKVFIHEVRSFWYNDFMTTGKVYPIESSEVKLQGVLIKTSKENIQVYFKYSVHDCGKPYRSRYDNTGTLTMLEEKAFTLNKNEYGRVVFNGRYTDLDSGNWWYEKKVYNIIDLDKAKKDIFIRNNPLKVYEQMAVLK